MTYFDSSALVPLYVPESFSASARREARQAKQLPYTALHRLEVQNAFELLVGRRSITQDEHRAVLQQLQDDLESQRLVPLTLDLERVFTAASDLSSRYSVRFLSRSLDLLHVAAARLVLCKTFVSADSRQLRVAKATGLRVVDITRSIRRRRPSRSAGPGA
jgi:predicted nucleic acid-binding protein